MADIDTDFNWRVPHATDTNRVQIICGHSVLFGWGWVRNLGRPRSVDRRDDLDEFEPLVRGAGAEEVAG
jgi:hypothetical protein